jgi:hypothetical protein
MREIFVFKDVNYGASKTSATLNTALNPVDLADGAIGIYGIDPVLNAGQLSLITDAAASSGSLVNKADFKGTKLYFAQGTSDSNRVSNPFDVNNPFNLISSQAYTVGAKGVTTVGYNGTSGALNFPSVISRGDEFLIKVNDLSDNIGATTTGKTYSGYAQADSADEYDILTDMLANIYSATGDANRIIDADITGNLVGTTDITGTSSTFVNGSTAVVHTGGDHGIDALDYITINGNLYQVTVDGGAAAYTLDRPYRGTSATVVVANIHDQGVTAATEFGLKVTDRYFNSNIIVASAGIGVSALITRGTAPLATSGRGVDILQIEADYKPHAGNWDNIPSYVPQADSHAVSASNYDMYNISGGSALSNSDHIGKGGYAETELITVFLDGIADTAGKNQSDFEDIMTVFYPDFISII